MADTPLPDLILYGRDGCHLCEDAHGVLLALLAERSAAGRPVPRLVQHDIDTDPAWHDAFHLVIPVVEVGDRRLELATSPAKLRRLLDDALTTPGGAA